MRYEVIEEREVGEERGSEGEVRLEKGWERRGGKACESRGSRGSNVREEES